MTIGLVMAGMSITSPTLVTTVLAGRISDVNSRIANLDNRFDRLDSKVDSLTDAVAHIGGRLTALERELGT